MPEYIPLAFGLEALYPPMKPEGRQLRELYMKLAETCRFTEFKQVGEGQGGRLSEGKNRFLHITKDRIVYRDDFTQALFTTFIEDVNTILTEFRDVFHTPVLLHTKALVRLLMPCPGQANTVSFFQQHVLGNTSQHLSQFERPISGVGMRFVFPPTQDNHSTYHLRVEPYFPDQKMFFLENEAQFFDPVVNPKTIPTYLQQAYDFVREKAGPFLLSLAPES